MSFRPYLRGFGGTAALFVSVVVGACRSAGFDGQVYNDQEMRFRVGPVPSTWRAIEIEDARLAFRDDAANATVAVNGRCGVDGDDVPLAALTQHLFLQFTARTPIDQRTLSLDGREALRTEITAELDGVNKHYLVYVLKKDGCVYDFVHIADIAAPVNSAEFERFVRGFSTLG